MVSDTVSGGFTGFHDYAPFGEEVQGGYAGRTSDWGTLSNGTDYLNQRYTGAERDTETTLDFLQARYLANQQARFVSADPAGNFVADPTNPQTWNMYSYTWNNPLAFVDPTGLCTVVNGQYAEDGGQPCPPPPSSSVTVSGDPFATPGIYQPGTCYGIIVDGEYTGSTCPGGGGGGATGGGGGGTGPPPQLPAPSTGCVRARFVSAAKGLVSLGVARTKFGLVVGSLASTPVTGPVGIAGAVYGIVGAAGNVAAAGIQFVGAISGYTRVADDSANVATTVTTLGGLATLVLTRGNLEKASLAASFESMGTSGVNGGMTGHLIDQTATSMQKLFLAADLGQNAADAVGLNTSGACH